MYLKEEEKISSLRSSDVIAQRSLRKEDLLDDFGAITTAEGA